VSHSSKAASNKPAITAGMNCFRLMQCVIAIWSEMDQEEAQAAG
jgi:hypothetical protein